jgi:tripartite motif-containing protein 71
LNRGKMMKKLSILLSVMLIAGWFAAPVAGQVTQELTVSAETLTPPAEESGEDGQPPIPTGSGVNVATGPVTLGEAGFNLRYLGTYGTSEAAYLEDTTHLNYSYGLWAGGSEVWVADSAGNRALRYTSDGTFQQQIGRAGYPASYEGISLEWIADVSLDGSGSIWLVDKLAHHLVRFSPAGQFLAEVGEAWVSGTDNAHFSGPESVAFDAAGNLYVSDTNNHRVQVFDPAGNWLQTYGITNQPGAGAEYLNTPRHIAIDDSNHLYIADSGNHRVQIFDVTDPLTIALAATLGISGSAGSDNGHFSTPTGVFVDASHI